MHFACLTDKIDNIITFNPYSPCYATITSANDSVVSLSRGTDGNHVTSYHFMGSTVSNVQLIKLTCQPDKIDENYCSKEL